MYIYKEFNIHKNGKTQNRNGEDHQQVEQPNYILQKKKRINQKIHGTCSTL
jgi:hypothetical protein